jgi:hypothetical protein
MKLEISMYQVRINTTAFYVNLDIFLKIKL